VYLLANATKTEDSQLIGDCNVDGTVDSIDVLTMKKYLLGISSNISTNADLNGDSQIDTLDLIQLKSLLMD
jgi:hypothetical protein